MNAGAAALSLWAFSALADLVSVPALGVRIQRGFRILPYAGPDLANDIYSMTLDAAGNVVVSSQGYIKVLHDTNGDGLPDTATMFAPIAKGAMGLCFDGVDLYYSGDGGLYRLTDADQNGIADGPAQKILDFGTGEHGGHAIRKGPDGWLYLIGGNDAGFGPQHISSGPTPPIRAIEAGALLRISPDGTRVEPIAHGFRNPYDFDFNAFGDLFTYDSDVERDFFLPWYTPTRIYHIGHAGHHGWRLNGYLRSWNRPSYYADTVEMLAEIGRGSPTGVLCYRHYQFPQRYRNGLFALDWTFGRTYFVPLILAGASYQSAPELFLEPLGTQGLAPTDLVVAPDGALLLSIGGRKTRGAIYRIDYPAGSPVVYPTNFLFNTISELETVLTAPQPLEAWSRASWVPTAVRLGPVPFSEAVMDGRWPPALRVRALEVLTELHGGLSPDAAALASQANSPLVRGRVAWSLGRIPKVNSIPILTSLSRDPESFVRRAALDSLGDLAYMLNPAAIQQAIALNLAHPEKRIRQAAARLATYLPEPAFKALWTQLGSGAPQARLTAALALLWRTPRNVINPLAIDAALSVIAQTRSPALREQAVRFVILALGDYRLKDPSVEVYTAYESALPIPPDLAQRLQRAIEPIFPSGDDILDAEVARLLAMVEDSNPAVAGKVLGRIAEKSSPTSDFHYLTVLSRLKALPPTNSSSRIAHAILALDRKLDGLEKRPKQNWSIRLAEIVKALLARDPKLAPALIADPEFAKPAHVALAGLLGPDYFSACAQRFRDAAEKNPRFVWSAQLIDILSVLPSERITPWLRRQWPNVALRDQIVLKLAEHPAIEDREKFIAGLSSTQSDVVRASLTALSQLPRDESSKLTVALLRLLRRSLHQPDQQVTRAQAVTLLSSQTGQPFKIQETSTSSADLQRAYQPVFNWFAQHDSALLRQLDADDTQDGGKWTLLLRGAPWDRGDRARGEIIFRERGCQTCHASATPIGPDLAGVASRLSRADLFDAIIFPSRDVAGPYRTTTFRTRDGQSYTGIVVFESADGVIVQTGAESTVRLAESDIISREPSTVSLMPGGLLAGLQGQGLADLYSYLAILGR